MYDSHLHQTVQLVISARKHQKFLRQDRWKIIHYGKYMFDFATLHEGPAMTGICLPSPTISMSTFSHIMLARRHPSRAIQRLQGVKRYRPLETQHEPPNIGWFISGCCVVSHQDYNVCPIVDKRHPAKNWDTKNANVVSTLSCGKLLGVSSLANSKTISFLGFSTSPENTPHQILSSASPKLREFQHQLLFSISALFFLLVIAPPKKNWSVFRVDLRCRKFPASAGPSSIHVQTP